MKELAPILNSPLTSLTTEPLTVTVALLYVVDTYSTAIDSMVVPSAAATVKPFPPAYKLMEPSLFSPGILEPVPLMAVTVQSVALTPNDSALLLSVMLVVLLPEYCSVTSSAHAFPTPRIMQSMRSHDLSCNCLSIMFCFNCYLVRFVFLSPVKCVIVYASTEFLLLRQGAVHIARQRYD